MLRFSTWSEIMRAGSRAMLSIGNTWEISKNRYAVPRPQAKTMQTRRHILRSFADSKVFFGDIEVISILVPKHPLVPNPPHSWLQLLTSRYDRNRWRDGLLGNNK